MSDFDPAKINPLEAMKKLYALYLRDMEHYTDSATGELRKELQISIEYCPACGQNALRNTFLFKKGPFRYQQCTNCGLVYVNPRLCDEYTEALYREGRCMVQLKEFYLPTAQYRKETLYERKIRQIEMRKEKGRLLDFGSSTGYFMLAALEHGWDVSGIELNPFGVEWATKELALKNVYNRSLDECRFDEEQFDVITMWDVLEHLPEPLPVLRELLRYLKPDGLLVIETSHFDCFETEVLGVENTNLAGDMHVMHFTKKAIDHLLSRAGFSVAEVDIFGLDIKHILTYEKLTGSQFLAITEGEIQAEQERLDEMGKGCYIQVFGTPIRKETS